MQKTTFLTKKEAASNRKWYIIDATGVPLGRLATNVADLLRGKLKVDFTPNQDCGDYVVVINSDKVVLTGKKAERTFWYNYSGYKGGLRTRSGQTMLDSYSDELIRRAVKGMLPHNKLADRMILKLNIHKSDTHPHGAHNPTAYTLKI